MYVKFADVHNYFCECCIAQGIALRSVVRQCRHKVSCRHQCRRHDVDTDDVSAGSNTYIFEGLHGPSRNLSGLKGGVVGRQLVSWPCWLGLQGEQQKQPCVAEQDTTACIAQFNAHNFTLTGYACSCRASVTTAVATATVLKYAVVGQPRPNCW